MSPFFVMLLRLRNLLDSQSTRLELRDFCRRVKRIVGEHVCCAFHKVERDEDLPSLYAFRYPCAKGNLPSAGDRLDHLLVLDTPFLCVLGVDLDPAGRFLALKA